MTTNLAMIREKNELALRVLKRLVLLCTPGLSSQDSTLALADEIDVPAEVLLLALARLPDTRGQDLARRREQKRKDRLRARLTG